MTQKIRLFSKLLSPEVVAWTAGLMAMAFFDPATHQHLSVCPLAHMGFEFCPGCGLGRSIAWLYRGEFLQSFRTHPLGIPAVFILVYRIISLTLTQYKLYGKNY